ncbi:C6 transcription factor (AmdR), putative [Talaromyces stipitatus ATCC 10500]|uniref:C6 transcription factor (AmdR), putative n=1 Tax=Talaromyces stipitatus (strain ATCC 10500 / CBS 375.48 / QM 6759 / NRRL 1006) TaxID=441959 RepID=B8MFH4_TALSN|nr:C6 transcription factor (AmdR), putative [Talaromyces stipitatus ATCC 10500]EED16708.1 C6 transcription factor (AmdR), putative [Talaromyces stipitatus ATCC 10500]
MASAEKETRPSPGCNGIVKRRPGAACVHCHRRKVKCDAQFVGFPCSNCQSSGKLDCRIHEKKKRPITRSALNPVPILSRPLPPLEASVATSRSQGTATDSLWVKSPGDSQRLSHRSTVGGGVVDRSAGAAGPQHAHGTLLHHTAQSPPNPSDDRREMENRLVTLIDQQELDSREIQHGVRAIYVGHDVSNMSFLLRQQRGDEISYHLAGNEIPRRRLEIGHDQFLQDALTLPEKHIADELVDAYFTHVNPGYPIVEEELFMSQYRNRDPSNPPPVLLLQAILLIGVHVSRDSPEREELKNVLYRRCKWLFDNRIERNRDILVQTALLLTWHSDAIDDDVSANAHYWVGVAARIATGLGMHRDPIANKFVATDRRTWRRVWWILVQYDVLISLSYGRPQAINLEDSDVRPLTPADFVGCGPRVQIDFVIHFAGLCSMISYIIRERFGLTVSMERRKAILPEADEALANWSLSLPDSLRLRGSMDSWSAMLHLTYNNFLILLHRPHPRASAYSEDYGPHDAEICSAAAGVITSIFEELRQKDCIKYLWCSGVHTLFTAMIQVRVELRFSNPVLAINALRRFDSTLSSLRCLAEYWYSAETILRLFENSKKLQQDLRLVHEEAPGQVRAPRDSDISAETMSNSTTVPVAAPTISQSHTQDGVDDNAIHNGDGNESVDHSTVSGPQGQSEHVPGGHYQYSGNVLDGSNDMSVSHHGDGSEHSREYLDWKQLFPFAGLEEPGPMNVEGLMDIEEEWRQLYLEPQMSDLLQESIWPP